MKLRSILGTLFTLGIAISSMGQTAFHRLYPTVSDFSANVVSDAIQRKNGVYATVEFMVTPDATGQVATCDTIIYSEFRPKGDVETSVKVFIDPKIYGGVDTNTKATIVEGADGKIYISFNTFQGTDGRKQLMSFSQVTGQPAVATITSFKNAQTNLDSIQQVNLLDKVNKNLLNISTTGDLSESNVVFSNKALQILPAATDFVKILAAKDEMGQDLLELPIGMAVDAKLNRVATVGFVDSLNSQPFLLVTDTLGNVIMSKKYTDIESLASVSIPNTVLITKDTGYIISGYALVFTTASVTVNGFLWRVDKRGDIMWSKHITRDPDALTIVKSMAFNQSGDVVLALAELDQNTGETAHYAVEVDILGNEKDKKTYPRVQGSFDFGGEIIPVALGGTAWFTNCLKEDKPLMSILKLDDKLSTTCEEAFAEDVLNDIEYIADTLIWTSTSGAVFTKVNTQKLEGNLYDIPFVSLEVRPFCPNEPINWLFEVPIEGATFYEWSTGVKGPLLDSLRVFEEGKFSVTVTVDKDVCFMLCDTSEISRLSKPTAYGGAEIGNFCTNGKIRLNSGYNPGSPEIKSIVWSTGETGVLSIEVSTAGSYSVTYTDGCNEQAVATIPTGIFPKNISNVVITPQVDVDCITGRFTGRMEAKGNSIGLGVDRYLWSTGGTNNFINLDQDFESLISVTITDGCGATSSASFELKLIGKNEIKANIVVDKSRLCSTGLTRLNVLVEKNGRLAYKWSTGDVTPFLDTKTLGTYTVTITDLCNNAATAEYTVTDDDISPDNLKYAKVFFPDGIANTLLSDTTEIDKKEIAALKLNRSFGPIVTAETCPESITDYEFFVFNRWGQQVFESTDVADEWDGRQDGDTRHLSDTYVWVVRYNVLGIEKILKGDINMVR